MPAIPRVSLTPARDAQDRIRSVTVFRYVAISVLYVCFFAIALVAFGGAVHFAFMGLDWQHLHRVFSMLGAGVGSGGIGSFVFWVDGRERDYARQQQAFDLIQTQLESHPEDEEFNKKYQALILQLASSPRTRK
jgi:hypothetical protein